MQHARIPAGRKLLARSLFPFALAALSSGGWSQTTTEIYYDQHSIPHIFGTNDADAIFGLGYHHMVDYPIGTLNMLWLTSGRAAEVWGTSYLDEDRRVRLWEVDAIANRHQQEMTANGTYSLIQAYVQGIEAGRAWWRNGVAPSASTRITALLGANISDSNPLTVNVDPVPYWLNPSFGPYGKFNNPGRRNRILNVTYRLFDASLPITEDHVLNLGVAINSFFLLHSNSGSAEAFPGVGLQAEPLEPEAEGNARLASNGWMISANASASGNVVTLSDGHVPLNRLAFRPHIVQVSGDTYHATGLTMPGYPALYTGFNDSISWVVTAPAMRPDGTGPVAHNHWEVDLDANRQFAFDASVPPISLTPVVANISVYDPYSNTVSVVQETLEYVDTHASEPVLGFTRYPVILDRPALANETIGFEQAAFTTEGSPWEFFYFMGRAQNAGADVTTALNASKSLFGNGMNLMIADASDNLRYEFMARIPTQGSGVLPADYRESAVLDGTLLAQRWQGFETSYPAIAATAPTMPEVWINNNATPDRVEVGSSGQPERFTTADLASFPDYIFPPTPIATWRQLRAEDLLRPMGAPPMGLNAAASRAISRDQTDNWMCRMWPLFATVRSSMFSAFTSSPRMAQIDDFMDWVEEYRDHDETDMPNVDYDFVAHPFSQVTVYGTLLRSLYLLRLRQSGGSLQELTLGLDPLHAVHSNTGLFNQVDYNDNVEAMVAALDTTQRIWERGTLQERDFLFNIRAGLQNAREIGLLFPNSNMQLPDIEWLDQRFFSLVDSQWQDRIDPGHTDTRMTRWGQVNMLVLTPHHREPPERKGIRKIARYADITNPSTMVTPADVSRAFFYSALAPSLLNSLPIAQLSVPFYTSAPVRAAPLGGVRHSLFTAETKVLFERKSRRGYEQALYFFNGGQLFYFVPHTAGSQAMLSVELGGDAHFLTPLAGTEITVDDLNGLGYQFRFQTMQDFVDGDWQLLETDPTVLGMPVHDAPFP